MGLKALALSWVVLALACATGARAGGDGIAFLLAHQSGGGFAESGGQPGPALTAWAVLGLAAGGSTPAGAGDFLRAHESDLASATDLEVVLLAEHALGLDVSPLLARLQLLVRPDGTIGDRLNSTYWGVIALRAAEAAVPAETVPAIIAAQARSGGWSWLRGQGPDTDDTAAAVEALRAAGVPAASPAIRRGVAYLRAHQRPDGGFVEGGGASSNAQSTAWAIQALLAAGVEPGKAAFAYLTKRRRDDGSYAYDARYVTTPVWITATVLPAFARKPFPFG